MKLNHVLNTGDASHKHQPTLLYIRTDIHDKPLLAGGSVSHTLGALKGFLQLGYSIVMASSVEMPSLASIPLLSLTPLKNPYWLKPMGTKINSFLSNLFFTRQLVQLMRVCTDITSIYQRYSLLNFSGVFVSKLKKIPLLLEYNGSEVWVDTHWAKSKKISLRWLIAWVEKYNLQHAQLIIVVSDALKDELLQRGIAERKILVCPNGVDAQLYDPHLLEHDRNFVRNHLEIEKKFVFGFIGTFSPWHGIEILAHMIRVITKVQPHVHFLLIGDGPLKSWLEKELEGKISVTFTGLLSVDIARTYLAACDAFICPTQPNPDGSRFFGSPTKLFEYMSLGKPIIASDLEQLAQILEGIPGTYLVPPQDVEGFITAAHKILSLKEHDRNEIGNSIRLKAITHYSWLAQVTKIENYKRDIW